MSRPNDRLTSYLVGDLSEKEQQAVEHEFFTDPAAFDLLIQTETDLVDDYVRGRLSRRLRRRFERHYLAHATRRERVELAHSLAAKIAERPSGPSARPVPRSARWYELLWPVDSPGRTLRASVGLTTAALVGCVVWLAVQNGRLRRELVQTEAARALATERERNLQQQLSTAPAETSPNPERPHAVPMPTAIATLALAVHANRAPETGAAAPTLRITSETAQVRVQLDLDDSNYPAYRITVKPIGGVKIVAGEHLKPRRTRLGARLTAVLPADRLAAGDYLLTLSGEREGGATEDVSQSFFRVVRN